MNMNTYMNQDDLKHVCGLKIWLSKNIPSLAVD